MRRRFQSRVNLIALIAIGGGTAVAGAVDFEKEIKPVLEAKCLGCHNPNVAKGDLSLSTAEEVLGKSELVIPGKALASDLYLVATPEEPGEDPYMPEEGDFLTEAEAELLKQWIDVGAEWPEGLVLHEASKADKTWWAYLPLRASDQWPANGDQAGHPVDAFIEDRLDEEGLELNGMADKRVLIRRATYDLTGLPPTPEEVEAFVRSEEQDAYEQLIDRLLASPHYGERWGRHWLDVVRFGESVGFEKNTIINNLWPFRDYVIDSINADKPFDQFIREHIAGDVIGKGTPDVEIGSAFLVAGPYDNVGNKDEFQIAQIRANTLDEMISATGQAFLGMTLGCARCHDHKFDPILQRDYYGLYATFAGVRHGERVLSTVEETRARTAALEPLTEEKAALEKERSALEKDIISRAAKRQDEYHAKWLRPPVDRQGTEEFFPAVEARHLRLVCEARDDNPQASAGFRIDEFEIWSAEAKPRNVALASDGAKASGPAREIEDFPNAYGPQHAIDGKAGARFMSVSNYLAIELAKPTLIDRVRFSSALGEETPRHRKFIFPAEYRIEISDDGETWTEVAHGRDRQPVSRAHRDARWRKAEASHEEEKQLLELTRQINGLAKQINEVPTPPKVWVGNRVAKDAEGPFHLFIGGSPRKPGEEVVPASLSTLSEVSPGYELAGDAPESERRLQLANWIASSENPLAARVLANRLWHYHFGVGIVDTPNDFGYMGGRPTHPELLDFLAMKLIEGEWRLKEMHRLIMTSKTYRQSSQWRDEAARVDGDSRLLWRFPPRRLSAEEIRDTILAVSGKLDTSMGGEGYRLFHYMQDNVSTYVPLDEHGPETYRRAVYHQNARASVVDLMTEFDQPDCAFSAPRRAETTTPLQALTMLNHQFTVDMAVALAKRVRDREGDPVESLYDLVLQREPTDEERERIGDALGSIGLESVCRAVLNSSELIYLD